MADIGVEELKKIILKQDFLLDKLMNACINADAAANSYSEYACREFLKRIYMTWCEVDVGYKSLLKIIKDLEYEYITEKNRERVK